METSRQTILHSILDSNCKIIIFSTSNQSKFIHSLIHSFIHSFIHLFIYSFLHSFIHSNNAITQSNLISSCSRRVSPRSSSAQPASPFSSNFHHFEDLHPFPHSVHPCTLRSSCGTVIQDNLKIGPKYSTVPRAQEQVSERASERVSAAGRGSEASSLEQANE